MAVGVPENDVFAAADAVLARGERPTVERVRLHHGVRTMCCCEVPRTYRQSKKL